MFDKTISIIKLAVLLIVLGFIYFQFGNILNKLKPDVIIAPPQIIKIEDNALRIDFAASKEKVKELEKLLKESDSKILAEVKKRNEKIDEIVRIEAELKQTRDLLNRTSSHVYLTGKKTDHHFKKIYATASDGTKFPIAWAMFHPNQDDPEKLWKTGTYPIKFETNIIETEDTSGRYNRYVELNITNNQMKETKGNRYPVKIDSIEWAKNPITEKHLFWWNPRLAFQGLFTNEVFAPSLDISLASYGRTKRDMDWRFIVPSIGLANKGDSSEAVLGFSPVQWNFGNIVPLVENAFLGPSFAWDTEGEMSYGAGFSIPF
jgi:hypothetical protein